MKSSYIILFWFCIAFNISFPTYGAPYEPASVSFHALIKTPDKYNQKKLITLGYIHQDPADGRYILFENIAAMKSDNLDKGIWLYLDDRIADSKLVRDHWVTVRGTFSSVDKGHWQSYAGSLFDISSIEEKR